MRAHIAPTNLGGIVAAGGPQAGAVFCPWTDRLDKEREEREREREAGEVGRERQTERQRERERERERDAVIRIFVLDLREDIK